MPEEPAKGEWRQGALVGLNEEPPTKDALKARLDALVRKGMTPEDAFEQIRQQDLKEDREERQKIHAP